MPADKLPEILPAGTTPRSRLQFFAIGAAFRSGPHIGQPIAAGTEWILDYVTHVARGTNAGDIIRAYLGTDHAKSIDNWIDDENNQRLLYVCPVESLPFIRSNLTPDHSIEVSTTHRRGDGAPIRFLRIS